MAWPYDDEPFAPEVAQRMPEFVMPPISEPDYMGEFTAPQEPEPDDFFARVAMGSGPAPFAPMQLDAKPTGLEMLLALAGGFVNAKTRRAAGRVSETQERNQRAREAAKDLANRRWEMRNQQAKRLENRAALLENREYQRQLRETPPSQAELGAIRARNEASSGGRRAGAPLRPPGSARPRTIKPGPVMPELAAASSNLMSESSAFAQRGETAKADSTRNLAGRIKDVHALIRQAQSVEELNNIEIPDDTPPSVITKLKMAYKNRMRQLGATR